MKITRCLLAFTAISTLGSSAAWADVKLGVGAPITGPNAVFGEQFRRGVAMAAKDINAARLLSEPIVVIEGDDVSNPSQGVAVANKMATEGVAAVIGHFNSAVSIPAAKVYDEEGILLITPASTNPQLTESGYTAVFRTCGRDDQQGDVAAAWLLKNNRNSKIAIVHDQTTYGQGLADATRKAINAGGLKETLYEAVTVGDKDMAALITKMKDNGIDVVYFGGLHTEAGLIVRQMAEKGLKAQFISGDGIVNNEFANITGATSNGVLMTFGADFRQRDEAKDVVKRFRDQGYEPEAYTLYSYAAVQVWAQAAAKAKSFDSDKVAAAMRDGEYSTVLGKLSFDAKGDRKVTDYVFYRWNNGTYAEVK